jgi:RND family efflux transporter MFP subunit
MKKLILIIPLIVLMAAGIVLLKKRRRAVSDLPTAKPVSYSVRVVRPQTATVSGSRSFLAAMEPTDSADIASKLSARILEVSVEESVPVTKGDLLIRLDDGDITATFKGLEAQLSAAETQLDYSRKQYERNLTLYEAGGLALERLEASRVTLENGVAAVNELKQKILGLENQLEYARIRAPFDGTVGTVFLHPGDLAAPGKPILRLNSLSQKLTFSFIPASDDIHPGQKVLLEGREGLPGRIIKIYNDAKNGLAVAEVKVSRHLEIPAGSYLNLSVITTTASGCSVPVQALLHRSDSVSVMTYREKHFSEQPVRVAARDRTTAVIEPCVDSPVAVGSEAKLSLLPTYGEVIAEVSNE